ncbi:MAG: hypothetical protein PSX36_09720 [bacterium]|nr:hypothetical protein [bacterium]
MTPQKILFQSLFSLLIPSLLGLLSSFLLNTFSVVQTKDFLWGLCFFLITGIILNIIYTLRRHHKEFTQLLFVCTVLRLLAALIFIFALSFVEGKDFFNFALHFIVYFIYFIIFEIRFILLLLKNKSLKPGTYEK